MIKNILGNPPEKHTSHGIFLNISRDLFKHSPESFQTFREIFLNISRNPLEHPQEGYNINIPRSPLRDSPEP